LTGYIVEDLQGRAVVEIWGKADATLSLKIDPHGGNNGILVSDGGAALPVSDRAPIVIVHFHAIAANLAAARALAASLDSEKILADFPPEIRDRACNFLPSTQMLSLPDLLTGDALDVVELSSGQRLRGMLEEKSIKVVGVLGPVEVPMDSLLGITTSAVREGDRSVATCGGDVLRGRLDLSFLHLRQTDGTVDEVPESQIARLGIHERPASTRPADSAWISTAGGDRLDIETPAEAVEIRTRCGTLKLDASHLAEIDFCSPGHDAHQIVLTDGSRLSGIISALSLSVKPRLYDGAQLQVATSAMDEMHLHSSASPEAGEAQVKLVGGDVLVGTLTGDIAVETSFNTVTLHTAELASLLPSRDSHARVTAVLSDGVTIRGRVACADVTCVTSAGVSVQVPLMLLSSYTQPRPHATDAQTETARALVAQLSADDWDARQQAQAKLAAMGPVIGDFLRGIRADQSPEGQQRIDAVLEGFEKQAKHKLPNEAANLDPSRLPTD
jgi:hypothetical protein